MRSGIALMLLLPALELNAADKMKPEEVIAGHLNSLGTPEARGAVKSRIVLGKAKMTLIVGGKGSVEGRAFLFAEGPKFRAALPFDFNDYWGEHFFSDGQRATVGFSAPTTRSPLGNFLNRHDEVLKEGLIGGVYSTSWALLEMAARQPRLEYGGLKKIDGAECHLVTYRMKKGQSGDLAVQLYFDAATFRHVRSVFTVTQSTQMVGITESSRQSEGHSTIEEDFSDFKAFDGLSLPTHWIIKSNLTSQRGTAAREWDMLISKITHNETIDPKNFVIDQAAP